MNSFGNEMTVHQKVHCHALTYCNRDFIHFCAYCFILLKKARHQITSNVCFFGIRVFFLSFFFMLLVAKRMNWNLTAFYIEDLCLCSGGIFLFNFIVLLSGTMIHPSVTSHTFTDKDNELLCLLLMSHS